MSVKRKIDVKKQVSPTLGRSFQFCVKGILHRLFRAFLTLAVVVMAVAFFMALLTENAVVDSSAKGVEEEIMSRREAAITLSFLYSTSNKLGCAQNLNKICNKKEKLHEFAAISDLSTEKIEYLANNSSRQDIYLRFFSSMGVGKRHILIKKNEGGDIFRSLKSDDSWQEFLDRLEPLRDLKLPTTESEFREVVVEYPNYEMELDAFAKSWNSKINSFTDKSRKMTGDMKIEDWLCDTSEENVEIWRKLAVDHGFNINVERLKRIRKLLRIDQVRGKIAKALSTKEMREQWRKKFRENPTIDAKMLRLGQVGVVEILGDNYKIEQLRNISDMISRDRSLMKVSKILSAKTEAQSGGILSGRQWFLLIISFVVCMVGITNAMLMAITERFREIATMKCLGATDQFILTQFLIEASFQGILGGILGMIIGLVLSLLKNFLILGVYSLLYLPFTNIFYCGVFSLTTGIVLAILASIYPSWAASRMAPMEAMRVE